MDTTWVRARTAACVVLLLLLAGCSVPGPPGGPPVGAPPASDLPAGCSVVALDAAAASAALDAAGAGTTVCVSGDGLRGADLAVTRSGAPGRPVVLAGDGATVGSVLVDADHVVVQGLTVADGEGIVLAGGGLAVRRTEVRGAAQDGISCEERCVDVVIEDNTVVATDGTGIIVEGDGIMVRRNTVSGSVRLDAGDADGIRFFGTGIVIADNIVTDIKDDGYAGEPPHTDCFQTYDNSRTPTVGAVLSGNTCRNVDHQCLIATAEESGAAGVVGRSRDIEFVDNVCDVGGSQAVLVQWVPGVTLRGNSFSGPDLDRAAILLHGSTGAVYVDNESASDVLPYELDDESEQGFRTDSP